MQVSIDHQPLNAADKMVYKGLMLEDLPNAGMVFGYTNASWTLKADLITEWMCRLLKHMDKTGQRIVTPRNSDTGIHHRPFVDMESGYVQRALDLAPKQGSRLPWKLYQNYILDLFSLRFGRIKDKSLVFSNPLQKNTGIENSVIDLDEKNTEATCQP